MFQDRSLTCRDCAGEFTFSSGEQTFFSSKGLLNDPQRCPSCRAVAKRARTVGGPREFHAAICGSCGGQAMVPFAPRNDRPVYCSTCFDKVRAGRGPERRHRLTARPIELRDRHRARRPARSGRPPRFPGLDFGDHAVRSEEADPHGRHHHSRDGRAEPELLERRGPPGRRDGLEDRPQHPDGRGREVDAPRSATARSSSTGSRSRSGSSTRAEPFVVARTRTEKSAGGRR